jgi:hypothetical protein
MSETTFWPTGPNQETRPFCFGITWRSCYWIIQSSQDFCIGGFSRRPLLFRSWSTAFNTHRPCHKEGHCWGFSFLFSFVLFIILCGKNSHKKRKPPAQAPHSYFASSSFDHSQVVLVGCLAIVPVVVIFIYRKYIYIYIYFLYIASLGGNKSPKSCQWGKASSLMSVIFLTHSLSARHILSWQSRVSRVKAIPYWVQ